MKFLLTFLALVSVAQAEDFKCTEECAEAFYTHLASMNFEKHKMTSTDAAVYAYIVYENYAEAGNIDLTEKFMQELGGEGVCNLGEDWVRKDVADCFSGYDCEEKDATPDDIKTSFKECDADNKDGCSRIMGLMANQFGAPSCMTSVFPSELTTAEKVKGARTYEVFMAVMGNWATMGDECQTAIITAAGYKEGDDVVMTISDNADKIIDGAKVAACGYVDGKWDTENGDAAKAAIAKAGEATVKATTEAKASVEKLEATIKEADASPAAVLSVAAAAIFMLL